MGIHYQDSLYSWFIAVICSSLNVLMCGFSKVDNFLFVEVILYFEVTRKTASLSIFIFQICRALSGLLAGYLGQMFGIRAAMVLGSVMFSFGLGGCFFANDIITLYILWGGIGGLGSGLTSNLTFQVINVVFKKHYSKANGISSSGGPIGGLVFSSIIAILLNKYGLLGTFLMLGGIVMHGIPLSLTINISDVQQKHQQDSFDETRCLENYPAEIKNEDETIIFIKKNRQFQNTPNDEINNEVHFPSIELNAEKNSVEKCNSNINFIRVSTNLREPSFTEGINCSSNSKKVENSIVKSDLSSNENKQNIKNEKINANSKMFSLNSFKVFLNVSYNIIAFSFGCSLFHLVIYNTILLDVCLDKGLSMKDSTYVVITLYTVDLIGRLMLGWITDGGYLTRTNLSAICFFLSAISSLFIAWSKVFVTLVISVALQGMSLGCLFAVCLGIVPLYIEKELQTFAMGSAFLYLVPFSAITPTLLGFFRDELKSYTLLLYFVSSLALLTSFLLIMLRRVETWRKSK